MFKLILTAALFISWLSPSLAQANEPTISQSVELCPESFYNIPLYPEAKFCQLFADTLPASMSYFVGGDQQQARDYFIQQLGQADSVETYHGRIVMQYNQGQQVLIISKDGHGSQIDMLIKSAS
ncbi:hypothetical protein [Paraglaciecola aestuariivivens]